MPEAFDAFRSRRPTTATGASASAVTSLSSIGGGGSGVAAVLQGGICASSTTGYDRLGAAAASPTTSAPGGAPAPGSYYIVRGDPRST
jgi:hypothetical protein